MINIQSLLTEGDIFKLVISLGILVIAFLAYRLNLRNRKDQSKFKIKEKQIERVFALIKELQCTKCEILFNVSDGKGASSGIGKALKLNLFEIAQYDDLDNAKENHSFNDDVVLFENNSNQLLNIKEWLNDPILPKVIIDALTPLYNTSYKGLLMPNELDNLQRYVTINSSIWEAKELLIHKGKGKVIEGNGQAYQTWENLKEHCKNIKNVFEEWLKKSGIDEYNINVEFNEWTI